jgi:preprotein translocase subunit YajC
VGPAGGRWQGWSNIGRSRRAPEIAIPLPLSHSLVAAASLIAASGSSSTSKTSGASSAASLILLVAIFGAAYFFFLRPRAQAARRQRETLTEIGVGDEVLTGAGIFGRVLDVEQDRVTIETAPGTRITVLRSTIARRITNPPAEAMRWDDHDEAEAHAAYSEEDWHEDDEQDTTSDDETDDHEAAHRGDADQADVVDADDEDEDGDEDDEEAEDHHGVTTASAEAAEAAEADRTGETDADETVDDEVEGHAVDASGKNGRTPSPDAISHNGAAGSDTPSNGSEDETRSAGPARPARSGGGRRARRRPRGAPDASTDDSGAS